jgi:hypothetical protein
MNKNYNNMKLPHSPFGGWGAAPHSPFGGWGASKKNNYEKNSSFLVLVAIGGKLRHAKTNRFPRGKCACVLYWR